jgi:hypothetical protein
MLSTVIASSRRTASRYLADATGTTYGATLPLLLKGGRIEASERLSIVRHRKLGPSSAMGHSFLTHEHVRFGPEGGRNSHRHEGRLRAKTGLIHRSKQQNCSITSSVRANSDRGTVRPSAQRF